MNWSRFWMVSGLIFIGVMSRLLPHLPNFTAINAMTLFSVYTFHQKKYSFLILFATLFLSDLILGFYSGALFVYAGFFLVAWIGDCIKDKTMKYRISFYCVAASLTFFIVSNFGVWMMGSLYPKTLEGLGLCYLAGLPFLAYQIGGDLIYCVAFFSCFSLIEKKNYVIINY